MNPFFTLPGTTKGALIVSMTLGVFTLFGGERASAQTTIKWTGGGDAASWADPNNWQGLQVPGTTNNVIITNGTGATVVISAAVSVENILCNKALTISNGSLTVTARASSLKGALSLSNGASLLASGSGTALTSSGTVSADGANFYASGGAVLSLPGVAGYNPGCANITWQASGSNSVLELPGLTSLQDPTCSGNLYIQGLSGGQVLLTNLTTITAASGYVRVQADGSNSLVNLSALVTNAGPLYLEASSGGTNLVPTLANGGQVNLTLNVGGFISTAQFTNLDSGSLTLSSGTLSLPGVKNIDGSSLTVEGGAELLLPGVTGYNPGCANITWQASGSNSVLELPGLTSLQNPTCSGNLYIQGLSGGQVILTNLATITAASGYVRVQADGSNSLVNLSALANNAGPLYLEASGGGTNLVPALANGGQVNLSLNAGGFVSTAQFTNLDSGSLTLSSGTLSLPGVKNIDGSSLTVEGGAELLLPGVTGYNPGCANITWQASGSNSVLELPGLTSLQNPTCSGNLYIQGLSGGQVILTNLATITTASGYVRVQADGSNSLVNLSALANNAGPLYLEASGGGTNLVPALANGGQVNLSLNAGGFVSTAQFTNLEGGSLTLNSGTLSLPGVKNIDGSSLTVEGGAELLLPGVTGYNPGCANITWQASGSNSVLELPGLTSLHDPTCSGSLYIQGLSGGQVILTNLATITAASGYVRVQADGSNSLVNLSALASNAGPLYLEASGGGSVLLPALVDGSQVNLTLNAGGFISTGQTNINSGSLTLSSGTLSLPGVKNIDGASIYLSGGAVLSLPGLTGFNPGCANITWQASGSNSVLELPGLTSLQNPTCSGNLYIQGLSGGQVLLTNLVTITAASGAVRVQADGSNSLVNLSALVTNAGPLYLEATAAARIWCRHWPMAAP